MNSKTVRLFAPWIGALLTLSSFSAEAGTRRKPRPKPSPSPTVTSSPTPTPTPTLSPTPSPTSSPNWSRLGMSASDWDFIYNGYGWITFDPNQGIIMQPATTTSPSVTHAALILSHDYNVNPIKDFEISIVVSTEQQLRTPTPNAWEVFWLFFNYTSDSTTSDGNKKTNYFIFKPNGIELGKAYDSIGQTYLVTETSPTNQIGTISTIRLRKQGQNLTISINGNQVIQYQGTSDPNILYDQPGTFGLYTEDARVHIYSVDVAPL